MDHLNLIALKKFPLIEPGDNLNEIILKSISCLLYTSDAADE